MIVALIDYTVSPCHITTASSASSLPIHFANDVDSDDFLDQWNRFVALADGKPAMPYVLAVIRTPRPEGICFPQTNHYRAHVFLFHQKMITGEFISGAPEFLASYGLSLDIGESPLEIMKYLAIEDSPQEGEELSKL